MFALGLASPIRIIPLAIAIAMTASSPAHAEPGQPAVRSVRPGSLTLQRGTKRLTPELAVGVRWPVDVAISPDGQWIAVAVKDTSLAESSTSTQLHLLATSGGDLRQLTFSGSSSEPAWSPDGRRLAFTSVRDDSAQIYVLDLASGGEAKRVTELAGGASGPVWSPDGRHLAFASDVYPDCKENACNKQRQEEQAKKKVKARAYDTLLYRHWSSWDEGTRSHVFVMPADGSEAPRDLTPGKAHVPPLALSEGRGYGFAGSDTLVFAGSADTDFALSTNHDLFSVPLDGGAPRSFTRENKARDTDPVPSADGRWVAYLANARPGYESDRNVLTVHDRKQEKKLVRSASFDRSVEEMVWMPGNAGLWLTAIDHGKKNLYAVGLEAGEVAPVLEGYDITELSASNNGVLAFVDSRLDQPPEVWVYDTRSREVRQLSHLNAALAESVQLGKTESLDVDANGTKIHGFLVYPPDFRPGNKYPLLVLLHGGPQGAYVDAWHPRWNAQVFAARGYVVAMPNFRGSFGYGQRFTDAVTRDWGGAPYDDVMAFTDALVKMPFIDERWMCAAGASYGGYLVNWIAGHTTRFKCLITHAGVFNLESMWGDTEELWFPEWELGGMPWAGRELYRTFSPHLFIQNAKTPTLVTHGQLDYRVNLSQGLQMYTSLQRLGVPSRFVYFPDEGHFVSKPENWVYWYGEMLAWLGRYLR